MKKYRPRHRASAIVSIHDVMPETLPRVMEILGFLEKAAVFPVTLLVVPGRSWPARDIKALKSLQDSGYELAGHGWQHRAGSVASKWHRLHGLLISRNEAEHLSLSARRIVDIITGCYDWFAAVGLDAPTLYVPPAWALGRVPKRVLKILPFRLYETQTGVFDAFSGVSYRMPVAGYMADTALRAKALKIINLINRLLIFAPLRIAIHPDDLYLALSRDLREHLRRRQTYLGYGDLAGN
ncbi:MAG: polysaccharide deacetylase family protein [Desulfobacterales bacterium]|nr:polysaccharide deacetylase family protein [Desulfobacterales bacterium]